MTHGASKAVLNWDVIVAYRQDQAPGKGQAAPKVPERALDEQGLPHVKQPHNAKGWGCSDRVETAPCALGYSWHLV